MAASLFKLFRPYALIEVWCECGDSNCTGEITLSLEEYEEVRVHPRRFVIEEGHEVGEMVRVVGYGTGYVVGFLETRAAGRGAPLPACHGARG